MALIKCPECGGLVSEKAKKCPHCGCPMERIVFLIEQQQIKTSQEVAEEETTQESTPEEIAKQVIKEPIVEKKPLNEAVSEAESSVEEPKIDSAVVTPNEEDKKEDATPRPSEEEKENEAAPVATPPTEEPKSTNKGLLLAGIVGALLLICLGLFLLLRDKKGTTVSDEMIPSSTESSNIPDGLCNTEWHDNLSDYDVEYDDVIVFNPDNTFSYQEYKWDFNNDMNQSVKESKGKFTVDENTITLTFNDGKKMSLQIDEKDFVLKSNKTVYRSPTVSTYSIDSVLEKESISEERYFTINDDYSINYELICRIITDKSGRTIGFEISHYPGLTMNKYMSDDYGNPQKRIRLYLKGRKELYDAQNNYRGDAYVDEYGTEISITGNVQHWYSGQYHVLQ